MSIEMNKHAASRHILFGCMCAASLALYWTAAENLVTLALGTDEYSHTMIIPILSLALIIRERKRIFRNVRYSLVSGLCVIAAAEIIGLFYGANAPAGAGNGAFALRITSLVLLWIGAFVLCYGWTAFRAGKFALIFLLLTIPIPDELLGKVIYSVRFGSAEVAAGLFGVSGTPFLREGFVFNLPSVSIEIAKECSGIHSTMALLIVTLLAGHLFLRSFWKKAVLVLFAIPVVCITNGIRITTLTLLSIYVNRGFLNGRLHHEGGFLFFAMALVIMGCVLYLMGFRTKGRPQAANPGSPSVGG